MSDSGSTGYMTEEYLASAEKMVEGISCDMAYTITELVAEVRRLAKLRDNIFLPLDEQILAVVAGHPLHRSIRSLMLALETYVESHSADKDGIALGLLERDFDYMRLRLHGLSDQQVFGSGLTQDQRGEKLTMRVLDAIKCEDGEMALNVLVSAILAITRPMPKGQARAVVKEVAEKLTSYRWGQRSQMETH